MPRFWFVLTIIGTIYLSTQDPQQAFAQASAQGSAPKPKRQRTAYEDTLDTLLRERKFSELFEAVNARDVDTMDRALEWLRVAFLERGEGTPIGYLYSNQLFRAGTTLPGLAGNAFKHAATIMMLTTRWMVASEGFQCEDAAAPARRLQLINAGLARVDEHYRSLDLALKRSAAQSAFAQLKARFARRVDDDWLCAGGPTYAAAYTATHGPTSAAILPYDPQLRPAFRPVSQWQAQREGALQKIVSDVRSELEIELR